jgi:predicted nucleic acid-binding protein
MRRFFADTFYWVALLVRRDSWHGRATTFSHTLTHADILFTTDAVLLEFLAAISAAGPVLRQRAAERVEDMLTDPSVRVVEVTRARFRDGLVLYKSRPDKAYSLTDCISMHVMRREGLTDVLTNDRHFTQEGFHILCRDTGSR